MCQTACHGLHNMFSPPLAPSGMGRVPGRGWTVARYGRLRDPEFIMNHLVIASEEI